MNAHTLIRSVIRRHPATLLSTISFTALALFADAPVQARGVQAGTLVNNTATATFSAGGTVRAISSNTVAIRVDELIDVTVAALDSGPVPVSPGATEQVLGFKVSNAGNGPEAFRLAVLSSVGGNDFDPVVTSIAIDTNGNGVFDKGIDNVVAPGAAGPVMAPDTSMTVLVISTIAAGASDAQHGRLQLTATALTGTGMPGTVFAGVGEGGGDAVVGATHALAEDRSGFVIAPTSVAIVKSATIADPFGGTRAVPGAVITYRLVLTATGSGGVASLHIIDAIPTGTTYRPGTLTLENTALSDAADGDTGTASSAGIDVALGTLAEGSTRTVTFTVTIN